VNGARVFAGVFLLAGAACVQRRSPEVRPNLPFAADTLRTESAAPGVIHRFIWTRSGPWAIHVLQVDLDRCYALRAVKGTGQAAGRTKTSELLARLGDSVGVVGGVNADFFSLAAPFGTPVGALVRDGSLIAGPGSQPALAVDSSGAIRFVRLRATGTIELARTRIPVDAWNRGATGGVAIFDDAWGGATDSAASAVEVVVTGRPRGRVVRVDTTGSGVAIPRGGAVIVAGRRAPADQRAALRGLRAGDSVGLTLALTPIFPREAVGGRPLLIRDSAIVADVDTTGQPSFSTGRNPRTAIGIARRGRRVILVAVDGRQQPYSDGMSLRELANLMLALGARDALNLDGGGSTTLVAADRDSPRALRVANRPSDKEGERAVGDALAIVRGCSR
jgi:hypothetical protein